MSEPALYFFCGALLVISTLYACVGQAGASGYIAAMALFGFAPTDIKPTALVLNVLVSVVVSYRFWRSGHFSWSLLRPFAATAVPAALIGGYLTLPPNIFNRLLGVLLLVAAFPLIFRRHLSAGPISRPPLPGALISGAVVGLLAGLTGVGGGVLITPLLLYSRWATPHAAAATSAVFILLNSLAALAGHFSAFPMLPPGLPLFACSAVLGGAIGATLGSKRLSPRAITGVLGALLLVAGGKLLFA